MRESVIATRVPANADIFSREWRTPRSGFRRTKHHSATQLALLMI